MKVLVVLFITLALASGKGSGPYLPSGWRPDGPAFFLPSEVVKQPETPVSELSLQGSEASGSDFLQEYGPPKIEEVSQNLLNQGLPDVTIEQTFGTATQIADAVTEVATDKVTEISEGNPTLILAEEPSTEAASSIDANPPISAELPILDFVVQDSTSASVEQITQQAIDESQSNQQEAQVSLEYQQESSTAVSESEKVTSSSDEGAAESLVNVLAPAAVQPSEQNVPQLQNIPDIIASLEQEILTQQAEVNQAVGEITSVAGVSGSLEQVPEGFLEYGPPGFAEYGPPKGDQALTREQIVESNETRRRRFSPKFRHARKH